MRDDVAPDYHDARQARFRQSLAPVTLTHGGPADQAALVAAWSTADDDDHYHRSQAQCPRPAAAVRLTVDRVRQQQDGRLIVPGGWPRRGRWDT